MVSYDSLLQQNEDFELKKLVWTSLIGMYNDPATRQVSIDNKSIICPLI